MALYNSEVPQSNLGSLKRLAQTEYQPLFQIQIRLEMSKNFTQSTGKIREFWAIMYFKMEKNTGKSDKCWCHSFDWYYSGTCCLHCFKFIFSNQTSHVIFGNINQ